jgi:hypothetical protein
MTVRPLTAVQTEPVPRLLISQKSVSPMRTRELFRAGSAGNFRANPGARFGVRGLPVPAALGGAIGGAIRSGTCEIQRFIPARMLGL